MYNRIVSICTFALQSVLNSDIIPPVKLKSAWPDFIAGLFCEKLLYNINKISISAGNTYTINFEDEYLIYINSSSLFYYNQTLEQLEINRHLYPDMPLIDITLESSGYSFLINAQLVW